MASLTACASACSVPGYHLVVWMEARPSSSWICSNSHLFCHSLAQVRRRSCGAKLAQLRLPGVAHDQPPDGLLIPHLYSGEHIRLVDRPEGPPGLDVRGFEPLVDAGLHGRKHLKVRMPCLSCRRTASGPPLWLRSSTSSRSSSARRRPQPSKSPMMARSRKPVSARESCALSSTLA